MIDNPCEWGSSSLLIFSENVGFLVYYTHILPLVISLFLGFQILINNPRGLSNKILFFITIIFSIWVYFDLILWASPNPESVMFFWSAIVPFELLMYILALYLVYLFYNDQKDAPTWMKLIVTSSLIPIFLFAHTSLNVIGLSPDCDTGAYEGILIHYMYIVEFLIILTAFILVVKGYVSHKKAYAKKQLLYIGGATVLFLSFFSLGNITLFFDMGPYYEQYKLFGMPIFAAIVSYSIIRFGTFSVKTFASEILISILWILMFSILLFRDIANARPIILTTLIAFGIIGIQLSRIIRRETEQRIEIEKLAVKLEKANVRLKEIDKLKSEFVSIASHQLRSPITAIRGYASLLLENSYGHIPETARDPLTRIEESAKLMATSIEDYLNVSRIEGGNMKYNLSDFNLRDEVEHICDDLRPIALKSGLVLLFRSDVTSRSIVHADVGKVQQIIHNLINNSIKYTKRGSIIVHVRDDIRANIILVSITDTGIGMNEHTKRTIFQKFERAENANSINVSGTGLGLYVALQMAHAMDGDITAYSEGDEKGSCFTLTLPLIM